ncbi:unnamed protein product [Ilex paraguariensis]|uniref:Phytosulfokine-beta n=1 Tax=Ilex paraguariensis TaxID=185542 RepID=A0ABC8SAM3_9AQUA
MKKSVIVPCKIALLLAIFLLISMSSVIEAAQSTRAEAHGIEAFQSSRGNVCAMTEDGCFEEEDSNSFGVDYAPVHAKPPIHNNRLHGENN